MAYPSKTDRETILAAAMKQLEEQGLRGLSLRSLAASLELAPTALYRYFVDRSVLESALSDEVTLLLHASLQRAVLNCTPEKAIRGIARAYTAFARKHPNFYEVLLLPCKDETAETAPHEQLWGFVVEQVTAITGQKHAEEAALALWAFLHGMTQLEAAEVFRDIKPTPSFEFGISAWLAAASACHPKKR